MQESLRLPVDTLKFIVDAQLPPSLTHWLCNQGHQAEHVQDIDMRHAEDSLIWRHALADNSVVLTKDKDFAGRKQQSRNTPVIVWLRIGNCSNHALHEWFFSLLPDVLQQIKFGLRFIEIHRIPNCCWRRRLSIITPAAMRNRNGCGRNWQKN